MHFLWSSIQYFGEIMVYHSNLKGCHPKDVFFSDVFQVSERVWSAFRHQEAASLLQSSAPTEVAEAMGMESEDHWWIISWIFVLKDVLVMWKTKNCRL